MTRKMKKKKIDTQTSMTRFPFEKNHSYRAKFLQQVEKLICNDRNKSYTETIRIWILQQKLCKRTWVIELEIQ